MDILKTLDSRQLPYNLIQLRIHVDTPQGRVVFAPCGKGRWQWGMSLTNSGAPRCNVKGVAGGIISTQWSLDSVLDMVS